MAKLKEVKLKMSAVKKTRQITKAMNMVAASKLRGAQCDMEGFRPYAKKFAEVLGSLAGNVSEESSPLLIPKETVKKIHLVLMTSDRGLCGGFNTNLILKADDFIKKMKGQDREVSVTAFGKKGRNWARKNKIKIDDEHLNIVGSKFNFNVAITAGRKLVDGFLSDGYDEVFVVYAEFISMAKQLPTLKQLLPIPPIETSEKQEEEDQPYLAEHICEPSTDQLFGQLLPRNVYVQLYSALLETSTSEHGARMLAMDNATKACNDMLVNLTLAYNKARQSTITAELMDIVGGAEALRG